MEHKGEDFSVEFSEENKTIEFFGTIRLKDKEEYQHIADVMDEAAKVVESDLILDFRDLKYLNSSGINMFSKFIIMSRREDKLKIKVLGNPDISWQKKSLINFQRLWNKVEVIID